MTLIHSLQNPSVYSLSTLNQSNWQSTILSWQETESLLNLNNFTGIMRSVNNSRGSYIFSNMSSAIQQLLNGNIYYGVVGNSLVNTYITGKYCSLNTSQPELLDYYTSIAYSYEADAAFLEAISLAFKAVSSDASRLYKSYFTNNCTNYNTATPLKINNLIGLYIIVGAGFIICLWVMLAEILYKEFRLYVERTSLASGTRYSFGKFYCARVIKVQYLPILSHFWQYWRLKVTVRDFLLLTRMYGNIYIRPRV